MHLLPAALLAVLATVLGLTSATAPGQAPDQAPSHTVSWKDGSPVGELSSASVRPGGLRVSGWDLDPSASTTPLFTWARVDGKPIDSNVVANRPVAAVGKAHPKAGPDHGFLWKVPVPEGKHTVCVATRNVGKGSNSTIGCVTKTFDYGPVGSIDAVQRAPGALRVIGWTYDKDDRTTPLDVSITIDKTAHTVLADKARPDVAKAHPSAGPDHGYDARFPVSQGKHTVCVTAINIGHGTNNSLGCRTITLDESPLGALDTVNEKNGKLHVRGWAFDPDALTTGLTVQIAVDGAAPTAVVADAPRADVAAAHPKAGADHGFDVTLPAAEGKHRICVTAVNVSYGSNAALGCGNVDLDFTPVAAITALTPGPTGLSVHGWAADPDTGKPISVRISVDGQAPKTVVADHNGKKGSSHRGRQFNDYYALTSGSHTICVVGLNVLYGTHNSKQVCRTTTLQLSPLGTYTSLVRAGDPDDVVVTGWALDPDTTKAVHVAVTVDGKPAPSVVADSVNPASAKKYPHFGDRHGLDATIATGDGEHTVCLTVKNVGGGKSLSLGCKLIIAVDPDAPSAPRAVHAVPGFGGATVTWKAPTSDGGAPVTSYTVTAQPGGHTSTVTATSLTTAVLGLKSKTSYVFTVTASNVAGRSAGGASATVRTTAGPPAQRTPAHVSTSRYIRNAVDASPNELATMRAEGKADAKSNPSGHGYLVLLDIGGQDQTDGGVVLSAGIRFVSYGDLVKDIDAYVDGYHSAQKSSAPVTIALGTNNDMDVYNASGKAWANSVVDPVRSHAHKYVDLTIAGADDIEPGFRADYSQTKAWLRGFLAATSAPFVFNGSADGCSWTSTNSHCNNGWTMRGLQYLAGGAAPTRILNLPQIYNSAMAGQWKYISLTGIVNGVPRINFAGPLTELTACRQAGGCGSMSGHTAWSDLWGELQSDSRLKVSSLPYSTDLRIDR
ncbi:fibronectin type III domain-containing protein [Jatrophihabitans endophyticus]|uniref:fibronectin type III domain-containing protein n=1 Tax=Jatrophihabitans endophyticus TaxID=1206085 RepID=UPI0019EF6359|nr:fibronectin type III domain-containing protein [Jatrophihabitans endophyticus]MBE7187750.1 fibronectin type III domain-containing protein [Jatrophihabitans endophyticus]